MLIQFIFVCLVLFWTLGHLIGRKRPPNYPPGPWSLPIIGGLYKLGLDPFAASIKLWHQYGPILSIDFASYKSILINDHKLIKSTFNNPAIQGRPPLSTFHIKYRMKSGIVAGVIGSEGLVHGENRDFTIKTLKEFGFGTRQMEDAILDQVDRICEYLDGKERVGIGSRNLFNLYTGNVIWVLLSARIEPTESQLTEAIEAFEGLVQASGVTSAVMLFPTLLKLAPGLTGWTQVESFYGRLSKVCEEIVESHKRVPCQAESDKDFIDLYIDKMNQTTDPTSPFYGVFGDFNLNTLITDMHMGGVDTSAEVMTWAISLIINYPDVQDKVHREIDRVIGRGETIKLEHRLQLTYITAIIKEVMRFRPVVPWGAPHATTEDTKIGDFNIPKGTTIYANLFAVAQDPHLWKDPHLFQPERFLLKSNELAGSDEFTPFSTGHRICPGLPLAMDELFLFLGNIFHRYHVSSVPGEGKPSLNYAPTVLLMPQEFKFIVKKR